MFFCWVLTCDRVCCAASLRWRQDNLRPLRCWQVVVLVLTAFMLIGAFAISGFRFSHQWCFAVCLRMRLTSGIAAMRCFVGRADETPNGQAQADDDLRSILTAV